MADDIAGRLTFGRARPEDTERIAQVMFDDPPAESVGIVGSERGAREMGKVLVRIPGSELGWRSTTVAELDGQIAGILQQAGQGSSGDTPISARLVWHTLRIVGPVGAIRMLPRLRARGRLTMKRPENSYHISELHVDAAFRGRGIGGALLEYAEGEARRQGRAAMSLVTTTVNPARRLYERHGFEVVETRTDEAFQRYTGIEGRHLMVKELD